jgi:SH3-like domain-containing protein
MVLALLVVGCERRKKAGSDAGGQAGTSTLASRPAGIRPGIEFFEPAKQARYEAAFMDFLAQYEAPAPGSALWFRLWSGRLVGGDVAALGENEILLRTTGVVERFAVTDLSMEARARVFAAEFARQKAMARVTGELRTPPPLTGGPPLEQRFPVLDRIGVRIGPDEAYRRVPDVVYSRGEPVSVLQTYGEWMRIAVPDRTNECWMHRHLTFALDELNREKRQADIRALRAAGLLVAVSPRDNTADLEETMWRGTDAQVRIGIARCLAAYCAVESGTRIVLVTLRTHDGRTKLGRYADGQGWQDLTPRR